MCVWGCVCPFCYGHKPLLSTALRAQVYLISLWVWTSFPEWPAPVQQQTFSLWHRPPWAQCRLESASDGITGRVLKKTQKNKNKRCAWELKMASSLIVLVPQLPGTLFIIGKPNDYHLSGPQPRLPSYESVRKKDRQRQIHSMIARRFGLDSSHDEVKSISSPLLKNHRPLY